MLLRFSEIKLDLWAAFGPSRTTFTLCWLVNAITEQTSIGSIVYIQIVATLFDSLKLLVRNLKRVWSVDWHFLVEFLALVDWFDARFAIFIAIALDRVLLDVEKCLNAVVLT